MPHKMSEEERVVRETWESEEQRPKRIAEGEEEIEYMHKLVPMEHIEASHPLQRILARERAALAELKRGMKGTQ